MLGALVAALSRLAIVVGKAVIVQVLGSLIPARFIISVAGTIGPQAVALVNPFLRLRRRPRQGLKLDQHLAICSAQADRRGTQTDNRGRHERQENTCRIAFHPTPAEKDRPPYLWRPIMNARSTTRSILIVPSNRNPVQVEDGPNVSIRFVWRLVQDLRRQIFLFQGGFQFCQSPVLDLPDSLLGHSHECANLLERHGPSRGRNPGQTEPMLDNRVLQPR